MFTDMPLGVVAELQNYTKMTIISETIRIRNARFGGQNINDIMNNVTYITRKSMIKCLP